MKTNIFYFIIIAALMISCSNTDKKTQEDADGKVYVKTITVKTRKVVIPVISSGKLSSKTETKLSFKTGGIIDGIYAEEGESVTKGQLLARLKLSEIRAKQKQASLGFQKAERDLQRVQNLYNDSVATLENLQDAKTAFEVAQANLEIANFNLKHSAIEAPSNGRILKRFGEVNEMIGQGSPVFLFAATDEDWVIRVNITDKDIVGLSLGNSALVYFDAYPEKEFSAEISEVANMADPYTGTYEVELRLHTEKEKLVSGFISKVKIFPDKKETYFLVPADALIEASGYQAKLYVLKSGKAEKRTVQIAKIDDLVYVSNGLSAGEEIIVDGVNYIKAGKTIVVENKEK